MCFDNIRVMREANESMAGHNDDTALGDQFDEVLTSMIATLTDNLKVAVDRTERGRAVISGKRDLMALLVEKTLEYVRVVDPPAEIVIQEIATQYENLIDQALNLVDESPAKEGTQGGGASQRQLQEKDREIKRLRAQLE